MLFLLFLAFFEYHLGIAHEECALELIWYQTVLMPNFLQKNCDNVSVDSERL